MSRPVLLFACFGVDAQIWLAELASAAPQVDIRVWPKLGNAAEIDYVLAWNAPAEVWRGLDGLKAVFSMGAGVDRLLADPTIPAGVPLARMVDPSLVTGMVEYVAMRVLHYHRQMPLFEAAQRERAWRPSRPPLPAQRRVGILGLGQLGGACARSLVALGFDVSGWSRSPCAVPGIHGFSGHAGLGELAAAAEILVCLLPLTPQTEGVLNRSLFVRQPRGACLINVARGAHLVDEDLISALDEGQLDAATLDVFRVEPLPEAHPFWSHPKITVTPHISALTQPRTAAASLMDNLLEFHAGGALAHPVDRSRGY